MKPRHFPTSLVSDEQVFVNGEAERPAPPCAVRAMFFALQRAGISPEHNGPISLDSDGKGGVRIAVFVPRTIISNVSAADLALLGADGVAHGIYSGLYPGRRK